MGAIERKKDAKEVQRDLALIKSPAAGLKRPAKDMEIEEDDESENEKLSNIQTGTFDKESIDLDTTIDITPKPVKAKKIKKKTKIIEDVESDQEMGEAN